MAYQVMSMICPPTKTEDIDSFPLGPYLENGPNKERGVYFGHYVNGEKRGHGKMVI